MSIEKPSLFQRVTALITKDRETGLPTSRAAVHHYGGSLAVTNTESAQDAARELVQADNAEQPTLEMPVITPEMIGNDSGTPISREATDALLTDHILSQHRRR